MNLMPTDSFYLLASGNFIDVSLADALVAEALALVGLSVCTWLKKLIT